MSEHDETTGQFTSEEPLYGLAGIEKDQGYVHYQDENAPKDEQEGLTVAEAAERYNSRTAESDIVTHRPFDLPDNVALTVDQAAKLVSESKEADRAQAELNEADRLRKEVDELRGVKPEDAAAKDAKATEAEAGPADPDAEIEKALNNPRIKEAIAAQIGETEAVRQNYQAGLVAATTIAQNAFVSQFPELANITAEQLPQAMMAMQQQDPGRYAQVESAVMKSLHLFEQHKAEQHRIDHDKQTKFQNYAKAQDAQFETLVKGETKETMRAVEKEIIAAIKDYGGDPAQFFSQYQNSEFLRDAITQRMMVDAAKYRMIQNAPRPKPVPRVVPHVQKPGVARTPGDRAAADLGELSRRLDKTGDIKDAFASYKAKQGRR